MTCDSSWERKIKRLFISRGGSSSTRQYHRGDRGFCKSLRSVALLKTTACYVNQVKKIGVEMKCKDCLVWPLLLSSGPPVCFAVVVLSLETHCCYTVEKPTPDWVSNDTAAVFSANKSRFLLNHILYTVCLVAFKILSSKYIKHQL